MTIKTCDVLVLAYDDIVEGMLSGVTLTIPEGCKRLMIKADAIERLNADLGFVDPHDGNSEDDDELCEDSEEDE